MGSGIMYHQENNSLHAFHFNVIDIKGSVQLSYTHTLELGLFLESDKQKVINPGDRPDVFTFNRKTKEVVLTSKTTCTSDNKHIEYRNCTHKRRSQQLVPRLLCLTMQNSI